MQIILTVVIGNFDMKYISIIFIVLFSAFATADIVSTSQLYYNKTLPNDNCGPDGQLATTKALKENIGQQNLCRDISSPWGIFKIQHTDGHEWSLMGNGYNCDIKKGVNPAAMSVCTMKTTPNKNTAYVFPSTDYRGKAPFDGKALVSHIGDEVPNTNIRSFRLGEDVQLIAYPSTNYQGKPQIYTKDFSGNGDEIRSYKLKAVQSEQDIQFNFTSNTTHNACLVLKSASNASSEASKICSQEGTTSEGILTKMQDTASTLNVAVYIEQYLPAGLQQHTGAFFIEFDGKGNFNLLHTESLPKGLTVNHTEFLLSFTFTQ